MILSYIRTVVLYLVLIFSVRLMGKRQIGQMEALEFVVTMLVANLASIPMQDGAIPLYSGLVPILTVLGLELVLSGLILYSVHLRKFFCGKPVILIDNGKILRENLRKTRVTLDELTGHLRPGEYEAELIAREKDVELVNIKLSVPTKDMAEAVCESWYNKNEKIYKYLMEELF